MEQAFIMQEEEKEIIKEAFPTDCHFKVISINLEGVHETLNSILQNQGYVRSAFKSGTRSSNGKYITYDLSLRMESYEHMKTLESALLKVEGVKLVL